MNSTLWSVSKDEDGYYRSPVAVYPNRLLAEASAYLANKGLGYEEYSAEPIPYQPSLPRLEKPLRLQVILSENGNRLIARNQVEGIVHFDPNEDDEAPVLQVHHERSWWTQDDGRNAAVKIEAYGTDHELIRDTVAAREHYLRRNWPSAEWTATYDYVPATVDRRRTRGFHSKIAAMHWLAEQWQAGKIGPVGVRGWPDGERFGGNTLEKAMLEAVGK